MMRLNRLLILFAPLLLFFSIKLTAGDRKGQMMIRGNMCEYDTIRYRTIAPGATVTSFLFDAVPYNGRILKMRAHLFTIDLTNPYNSFEPFKSMGVYTDPVSYSVIVAGDQQEEYSRQKKLGRKPVATSNGTGYWDNGHSIKCYESAGETMQKGNYLFGTTIPQFSWYIDADKVGHIGYTNFVGIVKKSDGTELQTTIGQINHLINVDDTKITVYCNGYSITPQNENAVDVVVQKADGSNKILEGDNYVTVKSIHTGGALTLGTNDMAISATNEIPTAELKALQEGDELNIHVGHVDNEGNPIQINEIMRSFINGCIRDGEVLEENEIDVARSAVGFSKDGKTCYCGLIESSRDENYNILSNGPVAGLADLMAASGCWNAVYMDGGPSAEMTLDGNWMSISSVYYSFHGRPMPDGITLFSEAPTDNKVVKMELDNTTTNTINMGESINLNLYGYNQYDEMIQKNLATSNLIQYTLSNSLLGKVVYGKFIPTKPIEGDIAITLNSTSQKINVHVNVMPVKGDANLDGAYDINDVTAASEIIANPEPPTGKALYAADINGDGKVTIGDVTAMISQLLSR